MCKSKVGVGAGIYIYKSRQVGHVVRLNSTDITSFQFRVHSFVVMKVGGE